VLGQFLSENLVDEFLLRCLAGEVWPTW
jgi:hypothetical protein